MVLYHLGAVVMMSRLARRLPHFRQTSRRPRKWVHVVWWVLGGTLLTDLVVLCCAMATVPKF